MHYSNSLPCPISVYVVSILLKKYVNFGFFCFLFFFSQNGSLGSLEASRLSARMKKSFASSNGSTRTGISYETHVWCRRGRHVCNTPDDIFVLYSIQHVSLMQQRAWFMLHTTFFWCSRRHDTYLTMQKTIYFLTNVADDISRIAADNFFPLTSCLMQKTRRMCSNVYRYHWTIYF